MSKRSVFISYSPRDAGLAKRVERVLRDLGVDALDIREPHAGEDWRKAVQSAIRRSDAMVLIASPHTLASSWLLYETGAAQALGKRIVVLLSNEYSVKELPEEISASQVVDFDPRAPERAAHDIVARLAAA
ncbi:MAG TPA: toll/interleukin-1 receptor domain-containing protein [Xanthobacteraceae bacterium]|nr:toll/interleukin-1 receptor domain-containing protein [Xanthobacteraceae bacterium]